MGTRLKRIAKVLFCLCSIELLLPGGTLIVLGYLLMGGRHIHTSAKGEGGIQTRRDIRGLVFANTAGGSSRRDANPLRGR
jgi:hypothetical protein